MSEIAKCEICGEPMPQGEEMFKFHGYSGPCPKPPLPREPAGEYHFERCENGDVMLMYPGNSIRIPKAHWCSVIAQMSYYGEEDYGWYRATNFHYGMPIHPTCPIKDKPVPEAWRGD